MPPEVKKKITPKRKKGKKGKKKKKKRMNEMPVQKDAVRGSVRSKAFGRGRMAKKVAGKKGSAKGGKKGGKKSGKKGGKKKPGGKPGGKPWVRPARSRYLHNVWCKRKSKIKQIILKFNKCKGQM